MSQLLTKLHTIQDNKILRNTAKYAFYLAVIIECLIVVIDKSHYINPIEGRLFQITFILCTLKVLLTKYEYREYIAIFLACLLGLMVDYLGDRNEILRMFMFVASCKDIDIKKCLKLMLWITTIGCAILALLSITGIYGELTVPKEYPGNIFVERYCFGMGNSNAFHIMFFALTLLAMYVYNDTMKWWGYAIIFIANIGVTLLTACKTGAAMTAVAVVGMWLVSVSNKSEMNHNDNANAKNNGENNQKGIILKGIKTDKLLKIIGIIGIALQPIMIATSVYWAWVTKYLFYDRKGMWDAVNSRYPGYNVDRLRVVDNFITGRINSLNADNAWSGSLKTWHLLPVKDNQAYFDLGYVRVFYWYGVLVATILLILVFIASNYLLKKRKYSELMIVILISTFTLIESHFVSVYIGRNYSLVIFGAIWSKLINTSEKV